MIRHATIVILGGLIVFKIIFSQSLESFIKLIKLGITSSVCSCSISFILPATAPWFLRKNRTFQSFFDFLSKHRTLYCSFPNIQARKVRLYLMASKKEKMIHEDDFFVTWTRISYNCIQSAQKTIHKIWNNQQFPLEETRTQMRQFFKNAYFHWKKRGPNADYFVTAAGTASFILLLRIGLRRFKTATDVPSGYYRCGKTIKGTVVAVNDSDNIRVYHLSILSRVFKCIRPMWRNDKNITIPTDLRVKDETINIRLAGIDAPEMGHFGGTPQPYSFEARQWLANLLLGKRVSVQLHRLDQYSRAVASVHYRRFGIFRKNVSLAMIEAGYATVYSGAGAEYGGIEPILRAAEAKAK